MYMRKNTHRKAIQKSTGRACIVKNINFKMEKLSKRNVKIEIFKTYLKIDIFFLQTNCKEKETYRFNILYIKKLHTQ